MRDTLMRENFKNDNSRKTDKDRLHGVEASVSDLLSPTRRADSTIVKGTKQTKNLKETWKKRQLNNELLNAEESGL